MIQLRANGAPTEDINVNLSQDGADVDIKINGEVVGFFQVQDGKVTLELCSLNEEFSDVAEKLNRTEDGFLVART